MKTCPKCKVTFQASETACHYCDKPLESLYPSGAVPCSGSLVPKSAYNVGDRVIVRCDEHPGVPFPATVSSVWWCLKYKQHEYRVMEDDTCESDGYTDEWLSPQNKLLSDP